MTENDLLSCHFEAQQRMKWQTATSFHLQENTCLVINLTVLHFYTEVRQAGEKMGGKAADISVKNRLIDLRRLFMICENISSNAQITENII